MIFQTLLIRSNFTKYFGVYWKYSVAVINKVNISFVSMHEMQTEKFHYCQWLPSNFQIELLPLLQCVKTCSFFTFRSLGVPPGRGSCPLIGPLSFDLIYTDYHGLQQMKQHMGLSFRQHRSVWAAVPKTELPFCLLNVWLSRD